MDYSTFDKQKGNVVKPAISSSLDGIVEYAAGKLAPLLGIQVRGLELPRAVLSGTAYYHDGKNIVAFSVDNLMDPTARTIGHEITHFLHQKVNPDIYGLYGVNKLATNLAEMVAYYGGIF